MKHKLRVHMVQVLALIMIIVMMTGASSTIWWWKTKTKAKREKVIPVKNMLKPHWPVKFTSMINAGAIYQSLKPTSYLMILMVNVYTLLCVGSWECHNHRCPHIIQYSKINRCPFTPKSVCESCESMSKRRKCSSWKIWEFPNDSETNSVMMKHYGMHPCFTLKPISKGNKI